MQYALYIKILGDADDPLACQKFFSSKQNSRCNNLLIVLDFSCFYRMCHQQCKTPIFEVGSIILHKEKSR